MAQTKIQSGGITDDAVETAAVKDLNVTAGKLSNTLDLSSKTVHFQQPLFLIQLLLQQHLAP